MKKNLLMLFLLVAGVSFKSFANHEMDMGGSLTYQSIAPNTYAVTYTHYSRDGFNNRNTVFNLNINSPGCNAGRTIPFPTKLQRVGGFIPSGYNLPLPMVIPYFITEMTATVVFTPAEIACSNINLSVNTGLTGQAGANLNVQSFAIYTEAFLKLTAGGNNSPIFDILSEPVITATKFEPILLSAGAWDSDGDSLVYKLVAPLTAYNQPVTNYAAIPAPFINPNPQAPYSNPGYPQIAFLTGASAYSPTFPLLSYSVNWATGQPISRADRTFLLNAEHGGLEFTPMQFTGINGSPQNIYLVSFLVEEYRKINGTPVKIGSVRRETIIIVGDAGANKNPDLTNIRVNNLPVTQITNFTISPGSTFNLQVSGNDANAADSVFLASNVANILPGSAFNVTPGKVQSATFTWTPTAAQVRTMPYYLRIWVEDNASPFAGKRVETIAIRVSNSGVSGLQKDFSAASFYAFPNPFSDEVNFSLNQNLPAREIIIYNTLGQQIDRLELAGNADRNTFVTWKKATAFASGTYVARLILKDGTTQTLKFAKLQ